LAPLIMKVKDVIDRRIITVDENMSALEAIRTMTENENWSVIVMRSGIYIGLMTDRDFIRRCVAQGLDPAKTPVGDLASCPLITIDPEETLGRALRIMVEKKIRRIFIAEGGKIVGRITERGLMTKTLETFEALSSVAQML
jgi:signal-transduction protein with cAMP-binding, CBS, and nucleotidyltransferase domain